MMASLQGQLELFVNGRPNGIYAKYNEKGNILESGHFENGKQIGTKKIFYPSGCLNSEKFYNQNGKEEGWSIIYFDNCNPTATDSLGTVEYKCQRINGIIVGEADILN
ncbi:MAG: hypothetical protein IPH66_05925 [Crocinitomicaceae bacterium]|nr:hypothetical protein [Crocinitomicaceae bacterium]